MLTTYLSEGGLMYQAAGKSLAGAILCIMSGCATPGYKVSLEAKGFRSFDATLWTELAKIPEAAGFAVVKKDSVGFFSALDRVSSYHKRLSHRDHDFIELTLCYCSDEADFLVRVDIRNQVTGGGPPVKAQIDLLGDSFYDRLSKMVGKEKVTVERQATKIPILY